MKTRPRRLLFVALSLLTIAFSFPVQIMVLYRHLPWETVAIFSKLAPLNWMVMIAAPITAWLVYQASPWSMAAVPGLSAVVVYNNWFVAEMGTNYSPMIVGIGTGFFLLSMGSLLADETRLILSSPERRWWRTPTRIKAKIPVHLTAPNQGEFDVSTFDLSEGGAFIPFSATRSLNTLKVGSRCFITISIQGTNEIRCEAEIVRATQEHGMYPAGIGVKFVDLGWHQRKQLTTYLKSVKSVALAA